MGIILWLMFFEASTKVEILQCPCSIISCEMPHIIKIKAFKPSREINHKNLLKTIVDFSHNSEFSKTVF